MTDANTPEPTPAAGIPVPPVAPAAPAAAPVAPVAAPVAPAAPGAYGVPGAATPVDEKAPAAYSVPATVVGQSKAARLGFIFSISQFLINVISNNVIEGIAGTGNVGAVLFGFALFRVLVAGAIVAAFIFGLRGLRETKDGTLKGRGFAIAAVVIASIGSVLWVITTLIVVLAL